MEQLNRIELRGTVGSIRRQAFNGTAVAHFSLVTSLAYKDKDGAPVIEDTWHNITAWEGRDIQELDKLAAGTRLYVTGRIRNQKYTDGDGIDRTVTEVLAKRIVVLSEDEPLSCQL